MNIYLPAGKHMYPSQMDMLSPKSCGEHQKNFGFAQISRNTDMKLSVIVFRSGGKLKSSAFVFLVHDCGQIKSGEMQCPLFIQAYAGLTGLE